MSRRQVFAGLCGTVFLVNMARVVFAPLLQPVAAEFSVTAASLGIVASAAWLGSALPRLPTGYLLTWVPRHYVVVGAGALLVVTSLFTGFAQSIAHLSVGAFFMGASSGMYFIAALPLVSELFPERVGRAIGVHGMSDQIAAVSAPLIVGGVLLVADWRTAFFLIAAGAAIATAVVVHAVGRTELPHAGVEDRSLLTAARIQWRLILTGVIVIGAVAFLWNGLFNLYGDYLETVKGIDPETGRLLLSLTFAAGIPAWVIGGDLADRGQKVPLMTAILLGFGAVVSALTVVEGLLALAVVSVLIGSLFFLLPPTVDTYLLSTLPDRHRGSAYAWYSSSMMLTMALGSGTIGTLVGRGFTYDAVFRSLAGAVMLTALAVAVLYIAGRLPSAAVE